MTADPHQPLRDDVRLLGTLLGDTLRAIEGEALFEAVAERHGGRLPNQDRGFVEAVAAGTPGPDPDLSVAVRAHEVVDAVYRSAAEGGTPQRL